MKAATSRKLPIAAGKAWEIAGRFNGLAEISRVTAKSELIDGGRIRRLTGTSGGVLLERLKHFDDDARTLSYEIIEVHNAQLAYGKGYRGRVRIRDDVPGQSCVWEYEAEFEPAPGVTEGAAQRAVEEFVQDCIDGACRLLGLTGS